MENSKKIFLTVAVFCALAFVPLAAIKALNGTNVKKVKVEIETKQGDAWFTALSMDTDKDGVLEIKNVLPGWYKMVIDKDDVEPGQSLAAKLQMLDNKGRRLKEKTDVELAVKMGDSNIPLGTLETDKKGWLKLSGLSSDVPYELKIDDKDNSRVSKKEGKVRIKVKTKIQKSNWFPSAYKRTQENRVLEVENILPGKYKFKYKDGDASPAEPFTLKIRLRNEDGEKIKEPTNVDLYAYVNKTRIPVGTMKTDDRGWIIVPGVMTDMKYKIDVKD